MSRAACDVVKEKARIAAGLCLPAAATAEAKAYARPAITVAAATVIRLAISTAIVRPRSVTVASIVRAVMTIAVVAVMPIVPAMRAEVSRLLRYIGCGFCLHRVVRRVCSGTAE